MTMRSGSGSSSEETKVTSFVEEEKSFGVLVFKDGEESTSIGAEEVSPRLSSCSSSSTSSSSSG
jgi:hypothetical protein